VSHSNYLVVGRGLNKVQEEEEEEVSQALESGESQILDV
jgi:hypothetical protein